MEKLRSMVCHCPSDTVQVYSLLLAISMVVLDGAIANIALPTIATDLQASAASFGWIINQSCHFCQS